MRRFTVEQMLAIPHDMARNMAGILTSTPRGISTDTRTLKSGDVFVALRGDTFDGHAFVGPALEAGARFCIVDAAWMKRHMGDFGGQPLLVVRDTTAAYGALAATYRGRFAIPVIGVTGSNGKTSTREMIAAALGTTMTVLHTAGNFNNQIGLPQTLLRLDARHEAAVLEMGTNQPGDIAELCAIARPTIGLITNIGRAHIERLGSREGIAREKAALFAVLPKDGTAVLNSDEPLLAPLLRRGQHRITFGTARTAAVRIVRVELDRSGRPTVTIEAHGHLHAPVTVRLRALGRHAAWNAAAALATAIAAGCTADVALDAVRRVAAFDKRMAVSRVRGLTIINDTYNANPDSTIAALDTLAAMATHGARIAVLGDMLELGGDARAEHERVGAEVARLGIPFVFTFGRHARAIATAAAPAAKLSLHFTDKAALCEALLSVADRGDIVLCKGSRGMRMDEVVTFLHHRFTLSED